MEPKVKQNYLNNRDMLKEIHLSKKNYSSFVKPEYHQYDLIIRDLDEVTEEAISLAKKNRAKRLADDEFRAKKAAGEKVKAADFSIDPDTIELSDIIIRLMTFDHVPKTPDRKKTPKSIADYHERVNFQPFQHWKFNEKKQLVCVGKSHWRGDIETGSFSKSGQMTDTLARMIIKLAERYSTRGNVRGYTYNDEMRDQAILQLTQVILQFDESKSDNPFSYCTSICSNAFLRVLNIEKKNQDLRDDILEMNGMTPSFTRINNAAYDADLKRFNEDYNSPDE